MAGEKVIRRSALWETFAPGAILPAHTLPIIFAPFGFTFVFPALFVVVVASTRAAQLFIVVFVVFGVVQALIQAVVHALNREVLDDLVAFVWRAVVLGRLELAQVAVVRYRAPPQREHRVLRVHVPAQEAWEGEA